MNVIYNGTTPLIEAIKANDISAVELLLTHGAYVNLPDNYNNFPIIVEIQYRKNIFHNKYILKLLLKNSTVAQINMLYSGTTPLIEAIKINDISAVKLLLTHGAYVNLQDAYGNKPLDIAIKKAINSGNLDIVKYLFQNGATTNKKNDFLLKAVKNSNLGLVKLLIKYNANINMDNGLLLDIAIKNNNHNIIDYLLDNGFLMNERQNDFLLLACKNSNLKLMKLLIEKYNANINMDNGLLLDIAIKNNDHNIMIYLLGNVLLTNERKNDLLLLTCKNYNFKLMKLLREKYNADINMDNGILLEIAIKNNDHNIIDYLLDNGFRINGGQNDFLLLACKNSNFKLMKLLIEKYNADIDVDNSRLLEIALTNNNSIIVDYLLDSGIRINGKQNDFLLLASKNFNLELVKLLINVHNADPCVTGTINGTTPLIQAIKGNNKEVVYYLINECNVDINCPDVNGKSPIDFARKNNMYSIKYFLIQHGAKCKKYEKLIGKTLKLNRDLKNKVFKIIKWPFELLHKVAKSIKKYIFGNSDRENYPGMSRGI